MNFGEEKLSHLLLGFFAFESNYQYFLLEFTFRLENCPEMEQKKVQQLYFITSLKFAHPKSCLRERFCK